MYRTTSHNDSYAQELKLAALGYIGYTLHRHDRIGYTFFYTRNATDTYQRREGTDAEEHELTGSNNITHIYTLQNPPTERPSQLRRTRPLGTDLGRLVQQDRKRRTGQTPSDVYKE